MVRFSIPGKPLNVNSLEREEYHRRNRRKQEYKRDAMWCIKAARIKPVRCPVELRFTWHVADRRRRDLDNLAGQSQKEIQDALVECGILPDDSLKCIGGFSHSFVYDDAWSVDVEVMQS